MRRGQATPALLLLQEPAVSHETERLLSESMSLSRHERAELAARLLESLDDASDPGAAQAWDEEIARRAAAARSGSQPGLSQVEFDELVRRLRS